MIYFFTPYSFQKKLFEAYDAYMNLIPNEDDWGWHDGPISYDTVTDLKEHKRKDISMMKVPVSEWFSYVYETGKRLQKLNLPDNNYDRAHCPQPVNKAEFLKVMSNWDMLNNKFTISNIYNNSTRIFKGRKANNAKIYDSVKLDEIDRITSGKDCLNYNDAALDPTLKEWLNKTFPNATKYEVFITDDNRRITVQKWFEDGCNYDEGLRILSYFAPKNRLLQRYFVMKRNTEIADRKLKSTLQLWLR